MQQLLNKRRKLAAASKQLSKLELAHGGLLADFYQTEEDLRAVQEELQQVIVPWVEPWICSASHICCFLRANTVHATSFLGAEKRLSCCLVVTFV